MASSDDDNNEQVNDNNKQVADNSEQVEAERAADRLRVRSLAGIGPQVAVVPEVTYIDLFKRDNLNTIFEVVGPSVNQSNTEEGTPEDTNKSSSSSKSHQQIFWEVTSKWKETNFKGAQRSHQQSHQQFQ